MSDWAIGVQDMTLLVSIIVAIIVGVVTILFLNRYYRKATRELALIRTGAGGQKIVLDGGCFALPFLHKMSEINMRTSKLEIERSGSNSIITSDRLRVDVAAEFYVRVEGNQESVAVAFGHSGWSTSMWKVLTPARVSVVTSEYYCCRPALVKELPERP